MIHRPPAIFVHRLLAIVYWLSAGGAAAAVWSTNLTAAIQSSTASNRPILLYFTATWCGPCRQMARTTLPDVGVETGLDRYTLVSLDIDAFPDAAAARQVTSIPAFLVLTPDGTTEASRATGYQAPLEFQRFLGTGLGASEQAQARQASVRKAREGIQSALQGSAGTPRQAAVAQLIELCSDRDPATQAFVKEQLERLAGKAPAELQPALEHAQLGVRLAAANALRTKSGDTFEFDPWAPLEERQAAVAQWRATLAQPPR